MLVSIQVGDLGPIIRWMPLRAVTKKLLTNARAEASREARPGAAAQASLPLAFRVIVTHLAQIADGVYINREEDNEVCDWVSGDDDTQKVYSTVYFEQEEMARKPRFVDFSHGSHGESLGVEIIIT